MSSTNHGSQDSLLPELPDSKLTSFFFFFKQDPEVNFVFKEVEEAQIGYSSRVLSVLALMINVNLF